MIRTQLAPLVAAALAVVVAVTASGQQAPQRDRAEKWWLDVEFKAHSILVDPADATRQHEVMDPLPTPMGILSPDGSKVAYIASDPARVQAGHAFDLFVADVDRAQPSAKANVRRLTTDQQQPSNPLWLPDSGGIVFRAGDNAELQVWYIDLKADPRPVRLSDGRHRSYEVSVLADGGIAWIVHKGSEKKQQFKDLVLHSSPATRGRMRTLLTNEHISSHAISPDGRTLAWSGLGAVFLVNIESGESRDIPLQGIHRQLLNHTAHDIAWRPDGQVLALRCGFLGGISRGLVKRIDAFDPNNPLGEGADEPWPRMFAEDKVFFVPAGWAPSPESLKVGQTAEDFPSPTADDPKADISPPAGDESKPWWIRELPEHQLGMRWISEAEAQARIAKNGE